MKVITHKRVPFAEIIPDSYVDIHSHLLPNLDDGVKTVYQTAYILETLQHMGVKKVITTPHIIKDVYPNSKASIRAKLVEIKPILHALGITITLEAAAEYMLDEGFRELLKAKEIAPLHDKYILVELSHFFEPINLSQLLFEIKLKGYLPILAHPERYTYYHQKKTAYAKLKEMGFLFQLDLLSLSNNYGINSENTAYQLLKEDYYDFVGSDLHNYQHLALLENGYIPKYAKLIAPLLSKNSIFG